MSSKEERTGKLKGIFDAARAKPSEQPEVISESGSTVEDAVAIATGTPALTTEREGQKPLKKGRARGKRSSNDYKQVSAYIPASMHLLVKQKLLREAIATGEDKPKEFSDLVQELLAEWLDR